MSYKNVVLVDKEDREVGVMEKLEAHQKGLLHRAFSIFIFNDNDEMLLQKRALGNYHSGGLWTNTCCSHPGENEAILEAEKMCQNLLVNTVIEKYEINILKD